MASKRRFPRLRSVLRWTFRLILILLIADLIYLIAIWPDWDRYASGPVPKSRFITDYEAIRAEKKYPKLRWQPVKLNAIPRTLQRAVLTAEDWRFYEHNGFDFEAIRDALDYNMEKKRIAYGASTISQQTTKNLFLSPSRDPLRKWHEIILTAGLEKHLSKRRILEIYLNVAEFGRGIYGVQAASQYYYGVPVSAISWDQALELAATLPGPRKNNPANQTRYFTRHLAKLKRLVARIEPAPPPPAPPVEAAEFGDSPLEESVPMPGEPETLPAPPVPDSPPAAEPLDDETVPADTTWL